MTSKALEILNSLRGVICTYKPPGSSYKYVMTRIQSNICAELNSLDTTPARLYHEFDYSGSEVVVKSRPSYADHVLCSGPKYQKRDVELTVPSILSDLMSGVLVLGINENHRLSEVLKRLNFSKCFQIKGILGQATTNFHIFNRVVAKAKYDKVKKERFEKILSSYQSACQRKMFEEYGFLLQSQEAYDFAVKGLYRPKFKGPPIIYSVKLVDFQPPHFTIEVQCLHATEQHLLHLIHNLGLNLKCYATCESIRCIRYGCFYVQDALVKEQWHLNEISENVNLCWDILSKNYPDKIKFSPVVETYKTSVEDSAG